MEHKTILITSFSAIVSFLLGGFDMPLQTLILFMAIDYGTGVAVALFFTKSPKTESGGLSSDVGFRGLMKKGMVLVVVCIAYRLDMLFQTNLARNTTILTFTLNEVVSILENVTYMGVDIPKKLQNYIEKIKNTEE